MNQNFLIDWADLCMSVKDGHHLHICVNSLHASLFLQFHAPGSLPPLIMPASDLLQARTHAGT